MQLHEKFIGLVIVCHGVNTIKLSQVKISTSEVIILGSEISNHTCVFFLKVFNEFITGCFPQVIGTQQVWDVTYCNQPITTLMLNYKPIPLEILFHYSFTHPSI